MIRPVNCKTFEEYARNVFSNYFKSHSKSVVRYDLVWDRYFDNSLKGRTRSVRGVGVRTKVTENGSIPHNWTSFLRCNQNKIELFYFLSRHLVEEVSGDTLLVACCGENVIAINIFQI